MKSYFHSVIPFLPFLLSHLTLSSPELDPVLDNSSLKRSSLSLYNPLARTTQKTACIEKACLLIWCLAMDVLFSRAYASAGMCLLSRCLAMVLYVTVYTVSIFRVKAKISEQQSERCLLLVGSFFGLLFYEDRGRILLRNGSKLLPDCMALLFRI
jgi:hypothetical protein